MTSARFISVRVDGATDVSTREGLHDYARLLENDKAVNIFVALKKCPNGKAQGITEAITLAMDEKDQNRATPFPGSSPTRPQRRGREAYSETLSHLKSP